MKNLFNELKQQPLAEFILSGNFGFKKVYKGTDYIVITDGVNKIKVRLNPEPSGHYLYTGWNIDGKKTDSIIGFLTNIIGLTYQDIRNQYGNAAPSTSTPFERAQREREQHQNKLEEAKEEFNKIIHSPINYLTENRGIRSSVIESYRGNAKVNLSEGVFPLYLNPVYLDLDKNLEVTGCGVKRHSIQKNKKVFKWTIGKKGLAILKQQGGFNELYICESVIDALSLECLYQKYDKKNNNKRAYISTCGTLTKEQRSYLKNLFSLFEGKKILAFDNNKQGKKYTDELLEDNTGLVVKFPKNVKDWNEVLLKDKAETPLK